MGIEIHLAGRYSTSGLLPFTESPGKWLERVQVWARGYAKAVLGRTELGEDAEGAAYLTLGLHPAAEHLVLLVRRRGRFEAHAKTSTAGPGYHIYVCDFLHAMETELGVAWEDPDPEREVVDETGFFHNGDSSDVFRAMTGWLGLTARKLESLRSSGADPGPFSLSLPTDHAYDFEEVLATPLGPRDEGWLEGASLEPNRGIDVFPWWHRGTGAAYLLGRALVQMWLEVRWRPPLWDEEEKVTREVLDTLAQASRLDPRLPYPYREWAELVAHLGVDRQAVESLAARGGSAVPGPLIGYRRRQVTVRLTGGWSLSFPGSFAERWDPESPGRFTAWEDGRSVHFTSYSFNDDAESHRALAFTEEMAGERFEHKADAIHSHARLSRVAADGGPYWSLVCAAAAHKSLAVVTASYTREEDRDWALETWRALEHSEEPRIERSGAVGEE